MVFECLLRERDCEGTPSLMFIAGFLFSFVSVFFSLSIYESASSILLVSFTAIAGAPLFVRVVNFEVRILETFPESLIYREKQILRIYFWFFVGVVVGYTFAFTLLPDHVYHIVTRYQMEDIQYVHELSADAFYGGVFWEIFNNNIRVVFVCFLLSFIYGTGGVFLLSWNASILATLVSDSIRRYGVFRGIYSFLSVLPHGIFEFSAYFICGFLGVLLSAIIMYRGFSKKLLLDALFLFLSALAFLVIGAWVESLYVSVK